MKVLLSWKLWATLLALNLAFSLTSDNPKKIGIIAVAMSAASLGLAIGRLEDDR